MAQDNSELSALGGERGELLRTLMRHCREMKRQETRSRWATGLLLLAFCTTFICLQLPRPVSKEASPEEKLPEMGERKSNRPPRNNTNIIHLHSSDDPTLKTVEKNGFPIIRWKTQNHISKFKLIENNTTVGIPANGLYMVHLVISYTVYEGLCKTSDCLDDFCVLNATVYLETSRYTDWIALIEGKEAMRCLEFWTQTIRLNKVVWLSKSDSLRVAINPKQKDLISWNQHTYFYVVRL